MKRMVMILIAISVMSVAELANAGITDLPSYPRLAALVNQYIRSIDAAQADYFAAINEYFQGLSLVDGYPDGVTNVTTDPTKKPSDQELDWFDFDPRVFAMSVALPVNIKIDTQNTAPYWGYKITFEFWRDLGTDAYGNAFDHWVYVYKVGDINEGLNTDPNAHYDEWFNEYDGDL
jgi:hypothetical protein